MKSKKLDISGKVTPPRSVTFEDGREGYKILDQMPMIGTLLYRMSLRFHPSETKSSEGAACFWHFFRKKVFFIKLYRTMYCNFFGQRRCEK